MNAAAGQIGFPRRVRVCFFNNWAAGLEEAAAYVDRVAHLDLAPHVPDPRDPAILRLARLDCDWYAENARCFASLRHPEVEFLPAWTVGRNSLLELAKRPPETGVERWLITIGHQPGLLGPAAGRAFGLLRRYGVRHLLYGYDEVSRQLPVFAEIAPHLDVLVHDELPLAPSASSRLGPGCRTIHRSWVANVRPFAEPFVESPGRRLLFLGSQMGLTPHRKRQIDFLREHLGDRFVAIHDHSVPVADRHRLAAGFTASLCPEGRKFTTPAMSSSHTDRPFWSGCLGLVPVAEDSRAGGRLEELHRAGLIRRYPHGDLPALLETCRRALEATADERRRIHEHFNVRETVGAVVADAIAAAAPECGGASSDDPLAAVGAVPSARGRGSMAE